MIAIAVEQLNLCDGIETCFLLIPGCIQGRSQDWRRANLSTESIAQVQAFLTDPISHEVIPQVIVHTVPSLLCRGSGILSRLYQPEVDDFLYIISTAASVKQTLGVESSKMCGRALISLETPILSVESASELSGLGTRTQGQGSHLEQVWLLVSTTKDGLADNRGLQSPSEAQSLGTREQRRPGKTLAFPWFQLASLGRQVSMQIRPCCFSSCSCYSCTR